MSAIVRFWKNDSAATAIEYSLIAATIALVIVGAVTTIGVVLKGYFTAVAAVN